MYYWKANGSNSFEWFETEEELKDFYSKSTQVIALIEALYVPFAEDIKLEDEK